MSGFKLEDKQEMAFKFLKERLSIAHLLALTNFEKTFEIECDALGVGISGILMQDKQLVIM